MVEVRFSFIGSIEGVKCTLDGEVKYSDASGFCSFFDISQGAHTYSVSKTGMHIVAGQDPFGRPLGDAGTTVIEWAPVPGTPWPEDQLWWMTLTFEAGVVIPWLTLTALPFTVGIIAIAICTAPFAHAHRR